MQYLGGKTRIAKRIVEQLPDARTVWEPFCGGLNMTLELARRYPRVVATDLHPGPSALGKALQEGWIPPSTVSEDEYKAARGLPDTDSLKTFVAFGCSFGGKEWGGYARPTRPSDNYPRAAGKSLDKLRPFLSKIVFGNLSFFAYNPCGHDTTGLLLYCDPPYATTTEYKTAAFDHAAFWARCVDWARAGSAVYVSEYGVPPVPHEQVWAHVGKKSMHSAGGQAERIERLFKILP